MADRVLRGGFVIDGTGAPGMRADVAVTDGRITDVGPDLDSTAAQVVDVDGLVVAPGVIDPHVHYDAQVMWDPVVTPSCFQGITTVIGGNCGFGVAPAGTDDVDYLIRLLARVEGMPAESLRSGPDWSWSGFDGWTARLTGRLGVNAGFFASHSTIRRHVMGDGASEREATESELAELVHHTRLALDAGALGFSTSLSESHHDGDGRPVPSRFASRDELLALAACLDGTAGTTFELTPALMNGFDDAARDFLAALSAASGRPVLWNAMLVDSSNAAYHDGLMAASDTARARGGRVVALTLPDVARLRLSLQTGAFWEAIPGWERLFTVEEPQRMALLRDMAFLAELRRGLAELPDGPLRRFVTLENLHVGEATGPQAATWNGRSLGDIAAGTGADVFDLFVEINLAEGLEVGFWAPPLADDDESWALRGEIWQRPDVLPGGGDAGAHLDVIDSFTYPVALLGPVVRDRSLVTLEQAVHLLTAKPAEVLGLTDRGRIAPGWAADLLVFDPATIGPGAIELRSDLPAGGRRLYSEATGIERVFVNGIETVTRGRLTGALPGSLVVPPG